MLRTLSRLLSVLAVSAWFGTHASAQSWEDPSRDIAVASARELAAGIYGNYYDTDVALSDAIIIMAFGVPEPGLTDLGGGLRMMSACRPHSCREKGAVVVDASSRVLVAGILHTNCSEARLRVSKSECADHRTLTVVQRTPANVAARNHILRWARERAPDYRGVTVIAP